MKFRKMAYSFVGIGVIIVIVCGVIVWNLLQFDETTVAFLDVGQGDAILISHGTHQILIDGGPDGTILMEQLGAQMPFWDRNIEIVIATHSDGDHIDGLISVFKNYFVDQFWHTNAGKDTSVYRALNHYAKNESNIKDIIAYSGLSANLGEGIYLDVVYPLRDDVSDVEDINNVSIVTLLTVGEDVFYFGGDLTSNIEDSLPIDDRVTVLKAGHHGSKSSTSEMFLQKTKPRDVVISVGGDNRYGHPYTDVLQNIKDIGAQIFRTDLQGTIVYRCGSECAVETVQIN